MKFKVLLVMVSLFWNMALAENSVVTLDDRVDDYSPEQLDRLMTDGQKRKLGSSATQKWSKIDAELEKSYRTCSADRRPQFLAKPPEGDDDVYKKKSKQQSQKCWDRAVQAFEDRKNSDSG